MDKKQLIRIFIEMSEILEIKDENPFKIRAYSNAARAIESIAVDIEQLIEEGALRDVSGIGDAIASKIEEFSRTGKIKYYEQLKESISPGLLDMLRIPSLGPKKVKALYSGLGIDTLKKLEAACRKNRVLALEGFGAKTQQNILDGIVHLKKYSGSFLFDMADAQAQKLAGALKKAKGVKKISIAGSLRRAKETVKDIDILIAADKKDAAAVMDLFTSLEGVERVIAKGDTKSSVVLEVGINCDLRIVNTKEYPYALHHFTGSKEHNTAMRSLSKKKSIKMNEYGLFKGRRSILCKSEKEIFAKLGLEYIPPELRENTGEIEAAAQNRLPVLVQEQDIKGLLHIHSNYSDGADSIEDIALAARKMGYSYIGISDHSENAWYAGGLTAERIKKQHREIDRLNGKLKGITILKGTETEIIKDGSLDYPDKILKKFDFVIAGVHSSFGMDEKKMTKRIIKAIENPYVTMLAHPTGRLLLSREAYAVDIRKVIDRAAELGKVIEINANPQRFDLDWRLCKYAKEKGALFAVNPDAHSIASLEYISYGVGIARKGWLTKHDILNARSLKQVMGIFAKLRNRQDKKSKTKNKI